MSRRTFLGVVGGSALLAGCAKTSTNTVDTNPYPGVLPNRMGVQLYTLRDRMEGDFEGTLESVAQIGYKEVEFAGYYDRTPDQVRALLDRLGLTSPSTHVGIDLLREDLAREIASAQTIGHRYLTIPAIMEAMMGTPSPDVWHRYAEEFNEIGAALQAEGLSLAYHNHHFEFVQVDGDATGFDVLLSETDPSLVSFEMDLMWTTVAGHDPVALFEKYPGRFVMWHVKDIEGIAEAQAAAATPGMEGFRAIIERIRAVGEGDIDFARIFAQAEKSGLDHYFVENDAPEDSLANIQTSHQNLLQLLTQP